MATQKDPYNLTQGLTPIATTPIVQGTGSGSLPSSTGSTGAYNTSALTQSSGGNNTGSNGIGWNTAVSGDFSNIYGATPGSDWYNQYLASLSPEDRYLLQTLGQGQAAYYAYDTASGAPIIAGSQGNQQAQYSAYLNAELQGIRQAQQAVSGALGTQIDPYTFAALYGNYLSDFLPPPQSQQGQQGQTQPGPVSQNPRTDLPKGYNNQSFAAYLGQYGNQLKSAFGLNESDAQAYQNWLTQQNYLTPNEQAYFQGLYNDIYANYQAEKQMDPQKAATFGWFLSQLNPHDVFNPKTGIQPASDQAARSYYLNWLSNQAITPEQRQALTSYYDTLSAQYQVAKSTNPNSYPSFATFLGGQNVQDLLHRVPEINPELSYLSYLDTVGGLSADMRNALETRYLPVYAAYNAQQQQNPNNSQSFTDYLSTQWNPLAELNNIPRATAAAGQSLYGRRLRWGQY